MAIEDRPAPETGEPPRSRTTVTTPAPTGAASALRALLLRLHFYAGLLIAPFLLVAATSGMLYALSYPAEKIVYSHELTAPVGDRVQPVSEQLAAARKANPEGEVTAVWPSAEEGQTTRVLMTSPDVEEGKVLAVFVDPYTAEVRGELPQYGSSGALPLRTWLSEFHRHLHLGEPGRLYSELAASWLWVVALGGVVLWIGRRRRQRTLLAPDRTLPKKGRARTLSWHGSVGLWAAAGLVALSATGLTWSTYAGENIGTVQDQLGGSTPAVSAALETGTGDGGGHEGHGDAGSGDAETHQGTDIGVDAVLAAAQGAGVEGRIAIVLPAEGTGYVVKETDTLFPVHLDSVAVNPADGLIIDELRFDDYPLLAKLTRYGIDLHMGVTLGLANQLALAALMLGTILLIVWGYRMWWLRRPTQDRTRSLGRPYPRGALRRLPPAWLVPLGAAALLTGWFVPLLGLSLLAFLAVDVALGVRARARN